MFADKYGLKHREKDVLKEVLLWGDIKHVASRLFIEPSTVRTYLDRIFKKCDVHSIPQLMAKYIREVIRGEMERNINKKGQNDERF